MTSAFSLKPTSFLRWLQHRPSPGELSSSASPSCTPFLSLIAVPCPHSCLSSLFGWSECFEWTQDFQKEKCKPSASHPGYPEGPQHVVPVPWHTFLCVHAPYPAIHRHPHVATGPTLALAQKPNPGLHGAHRERNQGKHHPPTRHAAGLMCLGEELSL